MSDKNGQDQEWVHQRAVQVGRFGENMRGKTEEETGIA